MPLEDSAISKEPDSTSNEDYYLLKEDVTEKDGTQPSDFTEKVEKSAKE